MATNKEIDNKVNSILRELSYEIKVEPKSNAALKSLQSAVDDSQLRSALLNSSKNFARPASHLNF